MGNNDLGNAPRKTLPREEMNRVDTTGLERLRTETGYRPARYSLYRRRIIFLVSEKSPILRR